MRIVRETKFDFMRLRGAYLAVSLLAIAAAIGVLATRGIEKGVEFAGGADVILRYVDPPALDQVRSRLVDAGLSGGSVTAFGDTGGAEIIIRVPLTEAEAAETSTDHNDLAQRIVAALRPPEVLEKTSAGQIDLNIIDEVSLEEQLASRAGLDDVAARLSAEALASVRRESGGVFPNLDAALEVGGLTEQARAFLQANGFAGPFALRGQEFIEASVSGEMRDKAFGAIVGALIGMLIYIWFRFQFQWGLAAILALVHDTLITLGAFSLAGLEANLPVVAAFLTLVGYSVNDTIVVFDRIRENLKARGSSALTDVINLSINQNLSRTLITSLTTLLAVVSLFVWGGPVIHPFAFVLMIGVVVGTYSSIYIASPILLIWQRLFPGKARASAAGRIPRAPKKVNT